MSRIFAVCLFAVFLLAVQAQTNSRQICANLVQQCRGRGRVTMESDGLTAVNKQCRMMVGQSRWKDLDRCQLNKAVCEITLVQCKQLTCLNIMAHAN